MKLTQIRNATLLLEYAGQRFLIDPMLAEQGAWPGFPGTVRSHLRNPLVGLPCAAADLLAVDAVMVTHTHQDHWDDAAQRLLPKTLPVYTQDEADARLIRSQGFTRVTALRAQNQINGISLMKTHGRHGSALAYAIPPLAKRLGAACGLLLQHPDEKTVYIAGDTVRVPAFSDVLQQFQPDVVVLNIGDARLLGLGAIIMGREDALYAHQQLPQATLVASHMEAINHCVLSRQALRDYARDQGFSAALRVPEDGETLDF